MYVNVTNTILKIFMILIIMQIISNEGQVPRQLNKIEF
jgi:hypothetical protein